MNHHFIFHKTNPNLEIAVRGFDSITIGKYIEMDFENMAKEDAEILVDNSCKKLLVNPNTQSTSCLQT